MNHADPDSSDPLPPCPASLCWSPPADMGPILAGRTLAAGDLGGDGYDSLVIGAPGNATLPGATSSSPASMG